MFGLYFKKLHLTLNGLHKNLLHRRFPDLQKNTNIAMCTDICTHVYFFILMYTFLYSCVLMYTHAVLCILIFCHCIGDANWFFCLRSPPAALKFPPPIGYPKNNKRTSFEMLFGNSISISMNRLPPTNKE